MVRPKKTPSSLSSTTAKLRTKSQTSDTSVAPATQLPPPTLETHTEHHQHATRSNSAMPKKQNTSVVVEEVPTRKRRMASLNAEFLVHYCSTNGAGNTNQEAESKKSKRRRTMSHASSARLEDNAAETTTTTTIETKQSRTNNKSKKAVAPAALVVASAKKTNGKQSVESTLTVATATAPLRIRKRKVTRSSLANLKNAAAADDLSSELDLNDNEEELNQTEEINEEPVSTSNKKFNKKMNQSEETGKQKTAKKKKTKKKQQAIESRSNSSSGNKSDDDDKKTKPAVLNAGRPKREASMRASAMIIQTNEIEKTRFQYYSSSTNPVVTLPAAPENTPSNKKSKNSSADFQVPQPMSLFASLSATVPPPPVPTQQKNNKKTSGTITNNVKQQPSNLRQISTTTTLSNMPATSAGANYGGGGDDSSSNDVLIVMETSGTSKPSSASKTNTTNDRTLTEELLAEHNKLNSTPNCGNGTFSSYTREYITKWAHEYKATDEKPFAPGLIPIESFGVKVLNEPQYLQHKSRITAAPTSTTVTTTTNLQTNSSTPPAQTSSRQIGNGGGGNSGVNVALTTGATASKTTVTEAASKAKTATTQQTKPTANGKEAGAASQTSLNKQTQMSKSVINSHSHLTSTGTAMNEKQHLLSSSTNSASILNQNNMSSSIQQKQMSFVHQANTVAQNYAPLHTSYCPTNTEWSQQSQQIWNTQQNSSHDDVNQLVAAAAVAAAAAAAAATSPIHLQQQHQLFKTIPNHTGSKQAKQIMEISGGVASNFTLTDSGVLPQNSSPVDYFETSISPYAKLKLKSEKLMDMRHQQIIIPNMPAMINVENLNFYSSIEEQQQQQQNLLEANSHGKNCTCCPSNHHYNHHHHHHHHHHQQQQQQLQQFNPIGAQQSGGSALPNQQAQMSLSSAAAAAAAAAVAMNIAKFLTNNNNNNNNKLHNQTSPSDKKKINRVNSKSDIEKPIVTAHSTKKECSNISVECTDDTATRKEDNDDIDKKSVLSISSSSSIKSFHSSNQNKKKPNGKKAFSCSSSVSGSVHLVVDETSVLIEEEQQQQHNQLQVSNQSKSNFSIKQEISCNDSNHIPIVNNNNESPEKLLPVQVEIEKEEICRWELIDSDERAQPGFPYIINKIDKSKISVDDFVLVERKIIDNNKNHLMGDDSASTTNYSIEENEDDELFVAKVCSFFLQNEKPMIKVKLFYKPTQLKLEIKIDDANELISSTNEFDTLTLSSIRQKCHVLNQSDFESKKEKNCSLLPDHTYFFRYEYNFETRALSPIVLKTSSESSD